MNTNALTLEEERQQDWNRRWSTLTARLDLMFKLFHDFHEQHDSKTVNGEKGKPGRKDLQLQLALYRQECVRIHNEFIELNLEQLRAQRKARA